ncbi:Uncharacterised protein [Mycobacteroides abscessus subsp. abscessus]|nr:Uncharacterised protein [Mycobacteroides abscessus subsp. abscessus]
MEFGRRLGAALGFDLVGPGVGRGLLPVAFGVGGPADLGVELLGTQLRGFLRDDAVAFEQLLLLGRGRERAGVVGRRLPLIGLFLQGGTAQRELLLLFGDRLVGQRLLLLRLLVLLRLLDGGGTGGVRLGDGGVLRDLGGLRTTPVAQVAALVLDRGDLEGVDDETLVVHRVRGLLLHLRGEGGAVLDDLLDGERADDRAQGTREDLLRVVVDLILLVEEALRGLAHVIVGAPDLDLSDTAQLEGDAVLRDAVDLDGDLPRGQGEDERLLHDRIDDSAPADDDPPRPRRSRGVATGDD